MVLFVVRVFSRCGETYLLLSQGALSYGRGCSAGCEDNFDCHEVKASAVAGCAGASTLSTILCTLLRIRWWQGLQPVKGVSWTLLAAARCGENSCNGHLLEFKNLLLAAESGYSLHRLNSLNSLICRPSMHAPSLASVMCVEGVGVVGVGEFCHGDTGVARLLGTARVDGSLHDVIHFVSACSDSLIRGHTECHGSSCAQMGSSPNSRVVRGLDFVEKERGRYGRVLGKSLLLLNNSQAGCM